MVVLPRTLAPLGSLMCRRCGECSAMRPQSIARGLRDDALRPDKETLYRVPSVDGCIGLMCASFCGLRIT